MPSRPFWLPSIMMSWRIFCGAISVIIGRIVLVVFFSSIAKHQFCILSVALFPLTFSSIQFLLTVLPLLYPCNEVVEGYTGFTMSVRPSVDKSYVVTGEERRIPFIFDDFHFCHSRVIGLDMTENRIFTLCHMIT